MLFPIFFEGDMSGKGKHTRKRNKIILFAAEGRNETETLYLKRLIEDFDGLVLKRAYGTDTDPVGMITNLIGTMDDIGFDSMQGDLAFCFMDMDCSRQKEKQVLEAVRKAKDSNVNIIVSNPCFELWYICHFTDSPKNYAGSKELVADISKYIKGYSKSRDGIYKDLKDKTEMAIATAKRLEERALSNGYKRYTAEFSPATDVYKIFSLIKKASKYPI